MRKRTRRLLAFLLVVLVGVASFGLWRYRPAVREAGAPAPPPLAASDDVPRPVSSPQTVTDLGVEKLRAARQAADPAERLRLFENIRRRYAGTWAGRRAGLEMGLALADSSDRRQEARNAISDGLSTCRDDQEFRRARTVLEKLNEYLVFMPVKSRDVIRYKVVRGDSLSAIASRFATTPEFLCRINGKRNTTIYAGETINVPARRMAVRISKSKFELIVYYGDYYLKRFPIGIGKGGRTPEEQFTVSLKLKNPDWWPGDGRKVPHGHPDNPLGTRWLGFADKPGSKGLGIHGTAEPDSIGKESSNGCIRMLNRDVEELYGMLPEGTKVSIGP